MLPIRLPPNVSRRPTLITLQSTMMAVLAQCPEAKQAVLMALAGIGNGPLMIEGGPRVHSRKYSMLPILPVPIVNHLMTSATG
jgi:hypothetical protein